MKTKFPLTLLFFLFHGFSFTQTIAGGAAHTLAICNDSTARAWGYNGWGQLGDGTTTYSNVPIPVNSISQVVAIAGGYYHSIALKNDGTVWFWGNGIDTAVQVSSLTNIIAIAGGGSAGPGGHSLALKNDGTVWAWGSNNNGELGNGTNTISNVPVQVSFLTGVIAIAAGGGSTGAGHSLALKNDGTVWAWGFNGVGELGNGTNTDSNVPIQLSSLTGMIAIGCGCLHSIAVKNDGTVWTWGWNGFGQLGNGTNTDSNVPVLVTGLSGVSAIEGGEAHSLALKNDSTVWAWGYNGSGQLGDGTNLSSNVPVPVSSLTGIAIISAGQTHSLAVKNDGTVWAWGNNTAGQLGNATTINSNVPVQPIGLCPMLLTATNKIIEPLSISIYPSPSTGIFTVAMSGVEGQPTENKFNVEIMNLLGGEMRRSIIPSGARNLTIVLYDAPSGIYFLQLKTEQGIATKKIIIQK